MIKTTMSNRVICMAWKNKKCKLCKFEISWNDSHLISFTSVSLFIDHVRSTMESNVFTGVYLSPVERGRGTLVQVILSKGGGGVLWSRSSCLERGGNLVHVMLVLIGDCLSRCNYFKYPT